MQMRSRSTRLVVGLVMGAALLVGTVTTAPTAGAATPANTAYVRSLYLDLLDRSNETGDEAGINFWADQLERPGMTRARLVQRIMSAGDEYYGNIVDFNYALFLDRTAEPAGRQFYIDQWKSERFTLERVVVALGGSTEYYNRVGATPEAFVDAIFFDVLGREPSASDQSFYQGVVASQGRARVAAILVGSTEDKIQFVNDQYGTFLGRIPSSSERSFWVDRLRNGLRREQLDRAFVASAEYYNRNSAA